MGSLEHVDDCKAAEALVERGQMLLGLRALSEYTNQRRSSQAICACDPWPARPPSSISRLDRSGEISTRGSLA